jgi:hypothetical protein
LSGYENVRLWFAKNEHDTIITIDEINEQNRHGEFLCPVCGSHLKAKAVKSKQVTSHFAHVDASKCNSESQIHFWFKHKFIEKGDKFTVAATEIKEYICKDILVEQSYETEYGTYKPDVTILTECGNTIYFEMAFTNKKKVKDYLDIWLELKNIVVEVDIKQLMLKGEIPTFKALFYESKCLNTKRNDTYYNTIGKYKEEKLQGSVDKELKERIRKLDWFWDDVFRYKKGEVDIKHMTIMLDSIDDKDKEMVNKILSKKSCNQLALDYINYKLENTFKYIKSNISVDDSKYMITTSSIKKSYLSDSLTANIEFRDVKENSISSYDIMRYNVDEMENYINNNIKEIIKMEKNNEEKEYVKSNNYIKNVIDEIDLEFKNIDENYNFHDRFCYLPFVTLYYNRHEKVDISLPSDIIYSNDEVAIKEFFMDKINAYTESVEPFENLSYIMDTLEQVKNLYGNLALTIDKVSYKKKIGKGKYKTYYDIGDIKYITNYKIIAQDLICIRIEKQKGERFNGYTYNLFIYKNGIYKIKSGEYKTLQNISNGEAKLVKSFNNDWENLESCLITTINELIHDDLECTCIECKDDFSLEVGEIGFFIKNKLDFPRRCKCCRDKRKQNKLSE